MHRPYCVELQVKPIALDNRSRARKFQRCVCVCGGGGHAIVNCPQPIKSCPSYIGFVGEHFLFLNSCGFKLEMIHNYHLHLRQVEIEYQIDRL